MGLFEKLTAEEDGGGGTIPGDFILSRTKDVKMAEVAATQHYGRRQKKKNNGGEHAYCQLVQHFI